MISRIYRYFFYLSLAFLVVALVRGDYFQVPRFESKLAFAVSLGLLFAASLMEAYPWQGMVAGAGLRVSLRDSLCSIGLSVFGKYIPGKVWMVVGRAAYLASRYEFPASRLAVVSVNAQLIGLWSGLLLGSVALFDLEGVPELAWSMLALAIGLTGAVLTDSVNRLATFAMSVVGRKHVLLPRLAVRDVIKAAPWYSLQWLLWSAGFFFFAHSLTDQPMPYSVGLAFTLAATLGILSLIAPGGLGVREGILAAYLASSGFSIQEATTISVASRLWFLCGECALFVVAFMADRMRGPFARVGPTPKAR